MEVEIAVLGLCKSPLLSQSMLSAQPSPSTVSALCSSFNQAQALISKTIGHALGFKEGDVLRLPTSKGLQPLRMAATLLRLFQRGGDYPNLPKPSFPACLAYTGG